MGKEFLEEPPPALALTATTHRRQLSSNRLHQLLGRAATAPPSPNPRARGHKHKLLCQVSTFNPLQAYSEASPTANSKAAPQESIPGAASRQAGCSLPGTV